MAEAEQAGIGAFLSNISTGMQEQQLSKQRKHKLWVACIMEGGDPEACSQIVGYDPGEEGRAGAQGIVEQRKAAERGIRMEEESKAALPMKAETAGELGMPVRELLKGATLPMKPEGDVTVYPRREDVEESRKVAETLKPSEAAVEKMPPWFYSLLPEEDRPTAVQIAAGLRAKEGTKSDRTDWKARIVELSKKAPWEMSADEYREMHSLGQNYDVDKKAWIPRTELPPGLFDLIQQGVPGEKGEAKGKPTPEEAGKYLGEKKSKGDTKEDARSFLIDMGFTNPVLIDSLLREARF